MQITIKKATFEDVEELSKFLQRTYLAVYQDFLSKEYMSRAIEVNYTANQLKKAIIRGNDSDNFWIGYYLAVIKNKIVGVIGGGMTDELSGIYVLYVDENYNRLGIATQLVDFLTQKQKTLGAKKQYVKTLQDNLKGNQFCKKTGFKFRDTRLSAFNKENENFMINYYEREI
ncbi:GNAT family N-acetyltransferase [Acholeplasma hippikon]|uniref:Putative acetyltransferase n=1 Tax=Acholeplasma hippikon TaxID=264636 RepID=A0A449BIT1_9MOLU|nr:GNAT family N-acetyltransferase [Acholeplasma hippikon]VEU82313.1 putative acetyltransferase [Acholeplasma hippikon]